jgi:hypothetical protein
MNNLATHVSFRVLVTEAMTASKVSESQDAFGIHTHQGNSGNASSTDNSGIVSSFFPSLLVFS